MLRHTHIIITAGWLFLSALIGSAQAQVETVTPDSAIVVIQPGSAEETSPPVTALEREVAAIREAFHHQLTELTTRYGQASDAAAATTIQHEIAALKLQLEIDLLTIQLRLARERADTAAIAELEQSLTVVRESLVADTGLTPTPAPAGNNAR